MGSQQLSAGLKSSRNPLRRILGVFGPLLAAFEIFYRLDGIISFGRLAIWLREEWRPFTHQFWTYVFDTLISIDINPSPAEMDSLTAAAFFSPLALASLLKAMSTDSSVTTEHHAHLLSSNLLRSAAFLLSISILFLISKQLIADFISVATSAQNEYRLPIFLSLLSFLVLGLYAMFALSVFFARSKISFWKRLLRLVTTGVGVMELIIVALPFVLAAFLATDQLGPIRTFSMIAVALSIVTTIAVSPRAIIYIAWCVAALAISSFISEIIPWE